MSKVECRTLQIRASQENEYALVGRAVKYNEISSNELATGLRERIMPGCFAASLAAGGDVKALLNHDQTGLPLGRLANGTLRLTDSEAGLDMRIQLDRANSSLHKDVYAGCEAPGYQSEMSFSFVLRGRRRFERCLPRQALSGAQRSQSIALRHVSIVTSPFYGDMMRPPSAARNHSNVDETFRRLSAQAC
jgi:HK97 family phage prohead protease